MSEMLHDIASISLAAGLFLVATSLAILALVAFHRPAKVRPDPPKWRVQFAEWGKPTSSLVHFMRTPRGTFDIFDDGDGSYMLYAPRSMRIPADLFYDLDQAKARAEGLAA